MIGPFAARTDRGMRRSSNQDAVVARELDGGWLLLAVADGVGGAFGGEIASSETVNALESTLSAAPIDDPAEALRDAIRIANDRVCQRSEESPELAQMGTTLVAALVRDGDAWIANLGDSRAYVVSGGALTQLTEDDSVVAEQVRAGLMTPEEAERSPLANVITRAIGPLQPLDDLPVSHAELPPGALLLLCSDGLFRPLTPDEIAIALRQPNLDVIAEQLISRANANGGPDNISVVLYRRPVDIATE